VGWEGKKWFQGLRRLLCSQPKAKKRERKKEKLRDTHISAIDASFVSYRELERERKR
jgi:hypothetical protein